MKQFSAPIPGQSLTGAPKQYAWERPPEITDPEEAIQMHITRLSDPDMLGDVLDLIELEELDIQTMVNGIMRGAVSNGIHSIDVALLVAPVVHEFIKQASVAAGIDVEDGFDDKDAKERQRQYAVSKRAAKKLTELGAKPKEVAEQVVEEPVEEAPMEMPEEMPKGLMAKGAM
jgi:hypothetical protein